jgi:HEAT repeat protein
MRALVLAFGLATAVAAAAQEKPPAPPAPAKPADAKADVDDDATAAKVLGEAEKGLADKEMRARIKALEPFFVRRHPSYVKRLTALLKDKDDNVAKTAARALGNQPFPGNAEALIDFGCNAKNLAAHPAVCASAIRAAGDVGLGKKGYERLRKLFDGGGKEVQPAICDAFGRAKEKRAFSFLVDRYDDPQPENKDDPNNPPASYWQQRHEEWIVYGAAAKQGLRDLTGVTYDNAKAWKEWAEGAGKAKGFVYAKGG